MSVDGDFGALRGRHILVVDDSVAITALLREVFTLCGATVAAVNTGREAIMLIRSGRFDLVLLDLRMPGTDGADVLRFMKAARPGLLARTILVTGTRPLGASVGGVSLADVCIVAKPFVLDHLRAEACRLLARPMDADDAPRPPSPPT